MTAYEIFTIFIGILALLMSFGSLIIAFLANGAGRGAERREGAVSARRERRRSRCGRSPV